jgi:hypothetical protein
LPRLHPVDDKPTVIDQLINITIFGGLIRVDLLGQLRRATCWDEEKAQ